MRDMTLYRKLAAEIGCRDSDLIPKLFAMIADEDEASLLVTACPDDAIALREVRPQGSIPA